ncbi:MAG: hypothetical protein WC725_04455 [Patescibacteria group bacterium]|jgi:hypothetical protein
MKNIILSPVPFKKIITIFFAGLVGALIFGLLFGLVGLLFANNLGFKVAIGSEELTMGASAIFYCLLSTPFGAMFGVWIASKMAGYKSNYLYYFLTTLFLVVIGLFFRDYFNLFAFVAYAAVCSITLTAVINYFAKIKSQNVSTQK